MLRNQIRLDYGDEQVQHNLTGNVFFCILECKNDVDLGKRKQVNGNTRRKTESKLLPHNTYAT